MSERHYSEAELKEILRDAAERSTSDGEQYTLKDIQRIAAEAQIAPEHVARAAMSLGAVETTSPAVSRWVEPAGAQLVRRVGGTVSPADAMGVFALARQQLGETGTIHEAAGGSEWRYDNGFSAVALSVVPDGTGAVVRIDARADGRQWVLACATIGASVFAGYATAAATSASAGLAAAAVALLAGGLGAGAWWNRSARGTQARLARLADAIAAHLGPGEKPPG